MSTTFWKSFAPLAGFEPARPFGRRINSALQYQLCLQRSKRLSSLAWNYWLARLGSNRTLIFAAPVRLELTYLLSKSSIWSLRFRSNWNLVPRSGIGPASFDYQSKALPLSYRGINFGGVAGNRTPIKSLQSFRNPFILRPQILSAMPYRASPF